ncbi:MAG: adenylate cyclase [Solirubrobacteraceae bacterium]|nr:adenylate cyclase [Solirubrobacteraceae bacterium]
MAEESLREQRSLAELERMIDRRLTSAGALANVLGAVDVFFFLAFLSPITVAHGRTTGIIIGNAVAGVLYLAITVPLGRVWVQRLSTPFRLAARENRPLDAAGRDAVLLMPRRFAYVSLALWVGAAVLAGIGNAIVSTSVGLVVFATILLGGVTTGGLCYLFAERIVRPVTALALESGPPLGSRGLGVRARMTLTWTLVTAVPLIGVVAVAITELAGANISRTQQAGAVLFFAMLALGLGLFTTRLTARAVADPLARLRDGLARVEEGDFESRVAVDDASEVGLLQAGFNRMTAGLGERERLRDLFGRHVGEEVAKAALESDPALGGEEREIAALFVDIVGSTSLATELEPTEVVAVLNRFFSVVVDVIRTHNGLVNKFEGDAALCIFGAPVAVADPAGDALAAARNLHARLAAEVPELDAAIGISAGRAVAGNVGAEQRFEYTVIGDPVNEAARLCELAKQRDERLLASEAAVERARPEEAAHWQLDEEVTLRGRSAPTRIAVRVPSVQPAGTIR